MTREEIETIRQQLIECTNQPTDEIWKVLQKLIPQLGLGSPNIMANPVDEAIGEGMKRIHAFLQTEMMRLICESAEQSCKYAEESCKSAAESSEIARKSCRWAAIAAIASLIYAILTAISVFK